MVIGSIKEWLINSVITAAITKLISMFNPAGAIIQAAMAIYNTVMFFIERGSQIAALAEAVFNSIGSIAAGNVAGAANYVEQTMGRSLPVMISFLARLIGLGGVSEHILNVIKKIQDRIENALNKLANFIVEKGKSLLGRGEGQNGQLRPENGHSDNQQQGAVNANNEPFEKSFSMNGEQHTLIVTPGSVGKVEMASKRDLLSNKIGRVISQLINQQPKPEEQINELMSIAQLAKYLQTKAKQTRTNPATKLNQVPGFNNDFNALVGAIERYGQRYHAKDIEQAFAKSSTPTQEQAFKSIVDKAKHIPPAQYSRGKHWKGNSENQRRNSSKNNGPGQFLYSMTPADVQQIERETLLTGEIIDKGSGTYHAFKRFSNKIGYANGDDAYWLRAELTGATSGAPTIHSHPRLSKE